MTFPCDMLVCFDGMCCSGLCCGVISGMFCCASLCVVLYWIALHHVTQYCSVLRCEVCVQSEQFCLVINGPKPVIVTLCLPTCFKTGGLHCPTKGTGARKDWRLERSIWKEVREKVSSVGLSSPLSHKVHDEFLLGSGPEHFAFCLETFQTSLGWIWWISKCIWQVFQLVT